MRVPDQCFATPMVELPETMVSQRRPFEATSTAAENGQPDNPAHALPDMPSHHLFV